MTLTLALVISNCLMTNFHFSTSSYCCKRVSNEKSPSQRHGTVTDIAERDYFLMIINLIPIQIQQLMKYDTRPRDIMASHAAPNAHTRTGRYRMISPQHQWKFLVLKARFSSCSVKRSDSRSITFGSISLLRPQRHQQHN